MNATRGLRCGALVMLLAACASAPKIQFRLADGRGETYDVVSASFARADGGTTLLLEAVVEPKHGIDTGSRLLLWGSADETSSRAIVRARLAHAFFSTCDEGSSLLLWTADGGTGVLTGAVSTNSDRWAGIVTATDIELREQPSLVPVCACPKSMRFLRSASPADAGCVD